MKKAIGIIVMGLLLTLVTSQAISKDKLPGCKIPKKPKLTFKEKRKLKEEKKRKNENNSTSLS